MAIFNSYVSLPEGTCIFFGFLGVAHFIPGTRAADEAQGLHLDLPGS